MNNILFNIFDSISNGLILLNDKLEIIIWNSSMERLIHKTKKDIIGKKIDKIIPDFGKLYYNRLLSLSLYEGQHFFFSSALHKDFMSGKIKLNITLSRISDKNKFYVLIEFIDITNQSIRISQLKKYADTLSQLNCDLKKQEKAIHHMAYHDKLTGLANRTLFYETAEKMLLNCKREKQILGIVFIDINKFKQINDTYGHDIGDKVLIRVADTLNDSIRENDIVSRYGGDEFLILLNNVKSIKNFKIVVSRIMNSKKRKIKFEEQCIVISLSIGVSFYPTDGISIDELIHKADMAMYSAKNKKKNNEFSFRI